jgi:cysteine dioxygenase type I
MNLDISAAPEIEILARSAGSARPFWSCGGGMRQVTAGGLASLVRSAAADPARWWPMATFDPRRPVQRLLDATPACELWLVTTPPGYEGAGHRHGAGCEVLTLVAGELTERMITAAGAACRVLRPSRMRVRGGGNLYQTINPGGCYAVSLCAYAPAPGATEGRGAGLAARGAVGTARARPAAPASVAEEHAGAASPGAVHGGRGGLPAAGARPGGRGQ